MAKLLLVSKNTDDWRELQQRFSRSGSTVVISDDESGVLDEAEKNKIDILLVDIENLQSLSFDSDLWEDVRYLKESRRLPVLILVPRDLVDRVDSRQEINDFILKPLDLNELEVRIKRMLKRPSAVDSDKVIQCGDLVIDPVQCEVWVAGNPVELTFKEFELLKFLASNKGRVYKREALLNEVWGFDYYGGDRTVDVHIRRLRSKIEDAEHSFIDTVRNIGYKFKNGG